MATVTLKTVWLNLASDPSQYLSLPLTTAVDLSPSTPGEDRQYGTLLRAITTGVTQRQAKVSVAALEPADVAIIRAWDGLTICYRDDSGMKFFGTYRSPQIVRHQYDANSDVSFTVTETSFSEVV